LHAATGSGSRLRRWCSSEALLLLLLLLLPEAPLAVGPAGTVSWAGSSK
jgi:hypothetical protein